MHASAKAVVRRQSLIGWIPDYLETKDAAETQRKFTERTTLLAGLPACRQTAVTEFSLFARRDEIYQLKFQICRSDVPSFLHNLP